MSTHELTPPAPTSKDKIVRIGEALVSEFPGGGVVSEFVKLLYDPISKRQEKWMLVVAEALKQLQGALRSTETGDSTPE